MNDLLALWRKLKKNGEPYYQGKFTLDGREIPVTIWIDSEAMRDPNCKRPAIKMVETEPFQTKQPITQPPAPEMYANTEAKQQDEISIDEIPF